MTGSLLLTAGALTAGVGAPRALSRGWASRAPRAAMAAWLLLSAAWLSAMTLAGLAAATGQSLTWSAGARHPAGAVASTVGSLLVLAVVGPASWHLARGLSVARRERRAHAAALSATARRDGTLDITILDDDAPVAYCLPRGRQHVVVVSAGAVTRLSPGQLHAVLAHERGHLRGRHHLMLTVAAALARAFPAVPLLARGPAELAVLAEMAADDAAIRRHDPADLAAAVVTLVSARHRAITLAAGGPAALARIERLLSPRRRSRLASAAALAIASACLLLPLAAAACGLA